MLDTLGSVVGPLVLFGLLSFFQDSPALYHNLLLFCAIPLFITLGILVFRVKEIPRESFENKQSVSGGGPLGSSFYLFLFIVALFTLGNSSDAFLILRAKNLGITLLEIPLVVALFNVVYALFAVPFGSLSDKIGRIPTMLIGWLAYALVYVGFAITHSSFSVWFLYAFYGVYYATNEGVAKAFLADLVDPSHRGRAFGLYGVVIGLTTLPASFLAGYLWDRFGPAVPFYFGSFLALFAAFLLLVFSRRLKPLRF
jgi:MFS family permease